jgi:hypothetical protein
MVNRGEIKKEDAWEYYEEIMSLPRNYAAFLAEFRYRTGITLIKGTVNKKEF